MPDLASIVTRKLGDAAYAVYGAVDFARGGTSRDALRKLPWIGFDEEHAYMPGQAWLHELLESTFSVYTDHTFDQGRMVPKSLI